VTRGARSLLAILFLAFVLVGSYYVWTGPDAPPIGERATLALDDPTRSAPPTTSPRGASPAVPLAAVRDAASPTTAPDRRRPGTKTETESAGPDSTRSDFGVIEVLPRRVVAGRADAGDGDEGEREADAAESDAEGIRVEVRPGDTLTSIARRHLGDGGRWREIHLANRETIGSDPDALKVGMVLVLPADPPR